MTVDSDLQTGIAPIEACIADLRAGKMIVLVDDEDRENEGDLVIAADACDAEAINFMAKHGRGLICLTLTTERCRKLGLPLMSQTNQSRHQTAFTVSIEAREGVTTGISASDRARTVAAATASQAGVGDVVSPGHIFPLMARDGGVLVRAGHTEASVDMARMAGFQPFGVICEIMKEDGEMARLPDLLPFAARHGLKIGTIADLIAYRRRTEKLVERIEQRSFESHIGGTWTLIVYRSGVDETQHAALVKGDPLSAEGGPPLVRMHAVRPLVDLFFEKVSATGQLHAAMRRVAAEGRGVIVALSGAPILKTTPGSGELRDYGVGAQILLDLGISEMTLLSNTDKTVIGLDGYGLSVVGREGLNCEAETLT